ncbi:hypothetical protein COV16_05400 [Candidatus Woesearchaeota archaeon CG10_big_fil_rev_8_21_14_0_10_34_8]|nr:MAG: hypothetical protein COV16_05400 [Candidatus Woesearchaeota archaeon CG10_big_fil_rev_8_21_14_0_10_34_8]
MIKEVLCDIEGTLVTGNGKIHPYDFKLNKFSLNKVMKNKRVGVITGRELSGYEESALERYLQFGLNGVVIGENGAVILDNGWMFDDVYSEYQNLENHIMKIGGLYNVENVKETFRTNGFLERMKFDDRKKHMVTLYMKDFPFIGFSDLTLYNKAKEMLPNLEVTYSSASIDVSTKGTNKGNAVLHYAKMKGLKLNEIAVFGDSKNDESMFDVVLKNGGLGFFVGKNEEMGDWVRRFVGGYSDKGGLLATRKYLNQLDNLEEFSKYRQFMRDNY